MIDTDKGLLAVIGRLGSENEILNAILAERDAEIAKLKMTIELLTPEPVATSPDIE